MDNFSTGYKYNIIGFLSNPNFKLIDGDIRVRIIGEEYREYDFTGRKYCQEKGIELYFNARDHRFSSSPLRKEVAMKE